MRKDQDNTRSGRLSLGPLVTVGLFVVAQVIVFQYLLDAMLARNAHFMYVYDAVLLALALASLIIYWRAQRRQKT